MMAMLSFLKYLRGIFNINLKSDTVHHSVIQSIYDGFVMADGDLNTMRLEMCLSTATGKWLEYWGEFFAVRRKLNEVDNEYARRIIQHVIRPKTTIPAIKDYIAEFLNEKYHTEYTDKDIDIKEPWNELSKYSHKGTLSHSTRFFSGNYYCHSVIDITIPEELTQDIVDLVSSIKAAGVRAIWSSVNSYDVISGYSELNNVWANYIRHIFSHTQRNLYSGLVLSNTSLSQLLSGRREIWCDLQATYYMYAKMWEKNTDESIVITENDLVKLLDYYEQIEHIFYTGTTGLRVSVDGILSNLKALSGDPAEDNAIIHFQQLTNNLLQVLQLVDDWLTLSQMGQLSTESGVMYKSGELQQLLAEILSTVTRFKQENQDYYNALQPPILTGEQAQYLVPRNINWLFDTPTMTQQDFYTLWEIDPDKFSLQDIFNAEQLSGKKYLTFGDGYQPPLVIAGSPWDWTPILDSPWLWSSAVLTAEELEEVYRMKFARFPDLVEIQTTLTTHPENCFSLSKDGKLSENRYVLTYESITDPTSSLRLSSNGKTSSGKMMSGKAIETKIIPVKNPNFTRYTFLSGDKSILTKEYILTVNTPTLGALIEFEENQDINTNEKIQYSTRDWMLAPVEITEGGPQYWAPISEKVWLWSSAVLNLEDLGSVYQSDENTITLGELIDLEEQSSVGYSFIKSLQSPIQVQPA